MNYLRKLTETKMDADPSIVAVVESAEEQAERKKHPGGRPKGSTNRNTAIMRFMLDQIVAGQLHNVDKALRDLLQGRPPVRDAATGQIIDPGCRGNPSAYLNAFIGLLDFNLPRLTRVEVKDDRSTGEDIVILATASPEEAQQAYMRLTQG
jgi:hypothetical protein